MPRSFLVKKAEIRSTAMDEDQKPKDFIAVGNISMKGNDYVPLQLLHCIMLENHASTLEKVSALRCICVSYLRTNPWI